VGIALLTTRKNESKTGYSEKNTTQIKNAMRISSIDMGSPSQNTTFSSNNREESVPCAGYHPGVTLEPIGKVGCASTIAMILTKFVGFCATTATSLLAMLKPPRSQTQLLRTSDFILDKIVEISPAGEEEVFDVQIAATENFIANGLVSHNTRWAVDDLAGRLIAQSMVVDGADKWEVLSIPAQLDEQSAELLTRISHDPKYRKYLHGDPIEFKAGDSYSPRRFPLKDLMRTKANMSPRSWSALYQQNPVPEEGGLLRSDWWRMWSDKVPLPTFTYVFQSYDVASETAKNNDNTARTTWGVFKRSSDGRMCIMVLEYKLFKMEFPDLLDNALETMKEYKPDRIIVEKASSGIPLYQELRRRGVKVSALPPKGTKYSRADAATIPLSQGVVYYPDRMWARELINVCAAFPAGPEDDTVDSATQGLNYARRMFMLDTPADEEDDEDSDSTDQPVRSYAKRHSSGTVMRR
jgi:predicted phage terminase large subunit-like protein